jgi:hypothetical protein
MKAKKERKKTATDCILKMLLSGKSITQKGAAKRWGVIRLGAIIFCLKKQGYIIHTKIVKPPKGSPAKFVGRYYMYGL